MDVERAYTIGEDEDGSFMDREDARCESGDPLDIIDRNRNRRLAKMPPPDDEEKDDSYGV